MLAINQQIAPPTRPKIPPKKKIPMILQIKSIIAPPNNAQSTKMEMIAITVAIIYIFYYFFFFLFFILSQPHNYQHNLYFCTLDYITKNPL